MLLTVSSLRLRRRKVDSDPSLLDLVGKRNHALQLIYKNLGDFSFIAKIRTRVYQIPQASPADFLTLLADHHQLVPRLCLGTH